MLLIQTLKEQVQHLEGEKGKQQKQVEQLKKENAKIRNGEPLLEEEMNDPSEELEKKVQKLSNERDKIRKERDQLKKKNTTDIEKKKVARLQHRTESTSQERKRTMKMARKDRVFAHFLSQGMQVG
jgi:chromosome segregation ATPase